MIIISSFVRTKFLKYLIDFSLFFFALGYCLLTEQTGKERTVIFSHFPVIKRDVRYN